MAQLDLQGSVDDILDLVHDVVLGEEVALVPEIISTTLCLQTIMVDAPDPVISVGFFWMPPSFGKFNMIKNMKNLI